MVVFYHYMSPRSSTIRCTSLSMNNFNNDSNNDTPERQPSRPRRPWLRRKVALACEPCRRRKVRCDGEMPICGPCKVRARPGDAWRCVYQGNSGPRAVVTKEYIKSLQDRIRSLEERGSEQRHDQVSGPLSTDCPKTPPAPAHSRALKESRLSFEGQPQHFKIGSGGTDRPGSITEDEDHPVNAMGTVMNITGPMLDSREYFYGTSSSVSFSQQIQQTQKRLLRSRVGAKGSSTSFPLGHNQSGQTRTQRATASASAPLQQDTLSDLLTAMGSPPALDDWLLPPRHLADHLMDCYWERVHCLYPFVHQPSFVTAYNRIWTSTPANSQAENGRASLSTASTAAVAGTAPGVRVGLGGPDCPISVFYSALNAIFALSVQFSDVSPASERAALSEAFLRRAKQVLRVDIVDEGNLALIQTLLIMAQYLQSTQYPNRCWNIVGLAVRMAQGLGLCVDCDDSGENDDQSGKRPFLEIQMRRRTWYGCVTLDLVLSMTLGRPTSLSDAWPVHLPAAVDDEYMDVGSVTGCQQPSDIFPRISFFIHTVRLYKILGKILTTVYNLWNPMTAANNNHSSSKQHHKGSETGCDISVLVSLDQELTDFEASIPPKLHWGPGLREREEDRTTSVYARQTNVLHARFLHLRILLYRPIFTQYCRHIFIPSIPAQPDQPDTARPFAESEWPKKGQENVLYTALSQQCSVTCVQAAQDLIDLISCSWQTNATGAWWYNMFYLFNSAMVILLAELCGASRLASAQSLNTSWQRCQTALQSMSKYHVVAHSCRETLDAMRRRMAPAVTSDPEQQRSQSRRAARVSTPVQIPAPLNGDEFPLRGCSANKASNMMAPSTNDDFQDMAVSSKGAIEPLGSGSGSGAVSGSGGGSGSRNAQFDAGLMDILWEEVGSLPTWNFEEGRLWWGDDEQGEDGFQEDTYYTTAS